MARDQVELVMEPAEWRKELKAIPPITVQAKCVHKCSIDRKEGDKKMMMPCRGRDLYSQEDNQMSYNSKGEAGGENIGLDIT